HAFREKQHQPKDIHELLRKLLKDFQIISEELEEYINSLSWNYPTFYDDDDIYTIQYREYLDNSSNAITPDLPTKEPDNYLSMGDEHLSTFRETKSDEVIKSSVENLVPIPSESKGIFDDTCDVPFGDNSPPLDSPSLFPIPVEDSDSFFEKSNTSLSYSDNSLPEFETFSNYTKETSSSSTTTHDSDEPNLDEPDLLVTPLSEANKDECFNSGGDVDEINDFKDGYYDSEGDILYLESLLSDDNTPNLPPEVFLDRDLRSLSDAPSDNLMSEIAPDLEASRAHGFVHHLLEL
nr:hypothetical protein [Tanacetum cinerariifolium]